MNAKSEMKLIRSYPLLLAVSGLGILAGLLTLSRVGNLAGSAVETILLLIGTSLFYLISCHLILRNEKHTRSIQSIVLAFAFFSRLVLAPTLPSLSEDLYRYRWEGRVQEAGGHPYTAMPIEGKWAGLRDETYPRVAGKDIQFGYGPLWCLIERGMTRVAGVTTGAAFGQVLLFKIPAALGDIGVVAALAWLLHLYGLAWERVLIYAWCPLVIVEFWQSGHNDAVMVLFLMLALAMAKRQRWMWAGVMVGLAAMVKLWPVFLLPLFFAHERKWGVVWGAGLAALPFAPWLAMLWERRDFVTGFLGGWRNNDSLFGLVLWLAGGDGQVAKRVSLALIVGWALTLGWRRMEPVRGVFWFTLGLLLVSANVHPWYLTWIVPIAAFVPSPWLLAWVSLMPVCYAVLIEYSVSGVWDPAHGWQWYAYAGAFVAAVAGLTMSVGKLRGKEQDRWIHM